MARCRKSFKARCMVRCMARCMVRCMARCMVRCMVAHGVQQDLTAKMLGAPSSPEHEPSKRLSDSRSFQKHSCASSPPRLEGTLLRAEARSRKRKLRPNYRCTKCGQMKKGHSCPQPPAEKGKDSSWPRSLCFSTSCCIFLFPKMNLQALPQLFA